MRRIINLDDFAYGRVYDLIKREVKMWQENAQSENKAPDRAVARDMVAQYSVILSNFEKARRRK